MIKHTNVSDCDMAIPEPKLNRKFTYQDYLTWPDDEHWEIIDGAAYVMSPAPIIPHQDVTGNIFHILKTALKGKPCRPYISPADVVLSDMDIVQPDVFVVCDPNKKTTKNIQGAPDLIFEVLSPSTAKKDRWDKKRLYAKTGVKEYILVDPDALFAERYLLQENGEYDHGEIFSDQQEIPLQSIPGLTLPLWEVFEVEKK